MSWSIRLGSGGGGAKTGFFATRLEADAAEEAGFADVATAAAVVALLTLRELLMVLVTDTVMGATVGDSVAMVVVVGMTLGVAVTTDVTLDAAIFDALAAVSGALLALAVAAGGVRPAPAMAMPGLLAELAAVAGAATEPDGLPVSLFKSAIFLVSSATRVDASLA